MSEEKKEQNKIDGHFKDLWKYFDVFQDYVLSFSKYFKDLFDYLYSIQDYLFDIKDLTKKNKIDEKKLAKEIGKEIKNIEIVANFSDEIKIKEPKWFKLPKIFDVEVKNKKPIEVKVVNTSDFSAGNGAGGVKLVAGGSSNVVRDASGNLINPAISENQNVLKAFPVADTDETDSTEKFYGFLKPDGNWYIMREEITGSVRIYRYTTQKYNTPSLNSDYANAWTNRATLTYLYASQVTF